MTLKNYDVIIVGAGAAGLMCAIEAGKRGRKVLVIDQAARVGEKIRISGGGRCNFTNLHASPKNYISKNPHFCVSALKRYTQHDFIALTKRHFIPFHEKTLGQLFCDGSAKQVVDMLVDECNEVGVTIQTSNPVTGIKQIDGGYTVATETGSPTCTNLVVATGGPSIPKMGSTGWGYKVAEQFGLKMVAPRAGLVPFTMNPEKLEEMKELVGVSTDVIVTCNKQSFKEGMLFTHRGLSGPAILQISSYWREGETFNINFFPEKDVMAMLKEKRTAQPKQELQTILAEFLPKKLAKFLADQTGLSGRMADFSDVHLKKAVEVLQNWTVKPNGTEGYRTAEVTLGGVDTDEISSKTFEAKNVPGLFFIGEVLDVTGWLGGYNFQWAWSSGHACGQVV